MTQTTSFIASDHPLPAAERRVLNRLLDLMIPASPDGRLPSAGALDLYADRERLDDAALDVLRTGVRGLARLAEDRLGCEFTDLDEMRAMALVDEYRSSAVAFFGLFVTHSAARYYQHDTVLVALGLEPRPPWPLGNELPEGDWSLLDPVRERFRHGGKLYRE